MRLLFHFLDLALINAFIIKKETTNFYKLKLFEFKLEVAKSLMYSEHSPEPMSVTAINLREGQAVVNYETAPNPTESVRFDCMNHWPEAVVNKPKCCRLKGCKLRSVFRCSKCMVFLCNKGNKNCFKIFHTEKY